jgi:hypothetical protein
MVIKKCNFVHYTITTTEDMDFPRLADVSGAFIPEEGEGGDS